MFSKNALPFIFLLLSLGVSLLLAELGLRTLYPHLAPPKRTGPLRADPELGWVTKKPYTKIEGYDEGTKIYFIGDSFTDNDHWPELTIKALNTRNVPSQGSYGGVAGYGTTQAYLKLKRDLPLLKPEVVVLLFYAWNDLRDNFNYPTIYYNPYMTMRPYLQKDQNVFTVGMEASPQIQGGLALQTVAHRAYELFQSKAFEVADYTRQSSSARFTYDNAFTWLPFYLEEQQKNPYVLASWRNTEESFRRMQQVTKSRNAKLFVLGIDNAFTVDKDVLEAWLPKGADKDLPLRRLEKLLVKLSIPYKSCLEPLREEAKRRGEKLYLGPPGNLSAHFTRRAEEIVAMEASELIDG